MERSLWSLRPLKIHSRRHVDEQYNCVSFCSIPPTLMVKCHRQCQVGLVPQRWASQAISIWLGMALFHPFKIRFPQLDKISSCFYHDFVDFPFYFVLGRTHLVLIVFQIWVCRWIVFLFTSDAPLYSLLYCRFWFSLLFPVGEDPGLSLS